METLGTLRAVVRGGHAVLIEDRVDYPDGTELELEVREAAEPSDPTARTELAADRDAAQRAELARMRGNW